MVLGESDPVLTLTPANIADVVLFCHGNCVSVCDEANSSFKVFQLSNGARVNHGAALGSLSLRPKVLVACMHAASCCCCHCSPLLCLWCLLTSRLLNPHLTPAPDVQAVAFDSSSGNLFAVTGLDASDTLSVTVSLVVLKFGGVSSSGSGLPVVRGLTVDNDDIVVSALVSLDYMLRIVSVCVSAQRR